jgi:diaminopimelate epimerase
MSGTLAADGACRSCLVMTFKISKLHATGNDFLVRLALEGDTRALDAETVATMCDRHRGIGADGLITITAGSGDADCTMILQNADGGAAEMSGNGIRCLAWVAARQGFGSDERLTVDTAAGRRVVTLIRGSEGSVVAADVDMGAVTIDDRDVHVTVHGTEYRGDVASIGNPHFVCLVDDPETVRVTTHGPVIERNERFQPQRTNVEFMRVDRRDMLTMRVWERGAGETLSCGTGACAAAAVAKSRDLVDERVCVRVPGGELDITVGETVRLGGPVVHIFDMDVEVGS